MGSKVGEPVLVFAYAVLKLVLEKLVTLGMAI